MINRLFTIRFLILVFLVPSQVLIPQDNYSKLKNYGHRKWKATKKSVTRAYDQAYEWIKKDKNMLKAIAVTAAAIVGYITLRHKTANWLVKGILAVPEISLNQRGKAEIAMARAGLGWELINLPASYKSLLPNLVVYVSGTTVFPFNIRTMQEKEAYLALLMHDTQQRVLNATNVDLVKNPKRFARAVLLYRGEEEELN